MEDHELRTSVMGGGMLFGYIAIFLHIGHPLNVIFMLAGSVSAALWTLIKRRRNKE